MKNIKKEIGRWKFTFFITSVFGVMGILSSFLIKAQNPIDQIPFMVTHVFFFLAVGLFIGYIASLLVCRVARWYDTIAMALLPIFVCWSGLAAKGGNWPKSKFLFCLAFGLFVYLVVRGTVFDYRKSREMPFDTD